jgi:hypothetical protein
MDDSDVDLSALAEFHLRIPEILKNWKSEIPPPSDVLEIWLECRRSLRHGVGMPEAKRREKLRIWRPGVANRAGVGARPEKSRVLEGWGGRIPGFQFFSERTLRFSDQGSLMCPEPPFDDTLFPMSWQVMAHAGS